MIDLLAGTAALAALYWLPGWLFLRRAGLDLPTRIIGSVVVSYAATTGVLEVLGAIGWLSRPSLVLMLSSLIIVGYLYPLPDGAFAEARQADLGGPFLSAGAFGLLLLVQALRPAIFRVYDALAMWAPLSREIAATGNIAPDSVRTVIEGFPPSVALIAGSASLLTGGFAEIHAFVVHPVFATLLLMVVVGFAGHLGGRRAAWIALIAVVATPLMHRGFYFHDDLVVGFFAAAAAFLAMRAENSPGWAIAGMAAGSALAVKHLGVVAILLVALVLIARLPKFSIWLAAALGSLVGLPWYLWNIVRFDNPIYPMMPARFGESADVIRIVADQDASMRAAGRGSPWEIGVVTLVLLGFGVATAVRRAGRDGERVILRLSLGLLPATVAFVFAWQLSGYASRHTLILIPTLAVLAGYGLAAPRASANQSDWVARAMPLVAGVILALFTVVSVGIELISDTAPADAVQTGIFAVLEGKGGDLRSIIEPLDEPLTLFGPSRAMWARLGREDPEVRVLSFDSRSFYIPQSILSGGDLEALSIYAQPDAAARHDALVDAGVGFVLDVAWLSVSHPLYQEALWQDLAARDDLYKPIATRNRVILYRVLDPD